MTEFRERGNEVFLKGVVVGLFGLAMGSAQASLYDRGGGLIFDSDRNITWLQNANQGAGSIYDD